MSDQRYKRKVEVVSVPVAFLRELSEKLLTNDVFRRRSSLKLCSLERICGSFRSTFLKFHSWTTFDKDLSCPTSYFMILFMKAKVINGLFEFNFGFHFNSIIYESSMQTHVNIHEHLMDNLWFVRQISQEKRRWERLS